MRWDHAAERQLLELVEDAAPQDIHFYVAPDRRNYLWNTLPVGNRSSGELLNIPLPEVRYYLRKLQSAGILEASFLANADITYISLPVAGHDRLAYLRQQTLHARGRRAVTGTLKVIAVSVVLPVMTSAITVLVMRALGE
ncbi:hypothetical protein [Paracoccus sp. T5]|uniref:hypothetical protein n=1 Tax=Paracoccus sp. T5 TaxID=3402161 RepID=UPI003AECB6E3